MNDQNVIVAHGLTKMFGHKVALYDLDLTVPKGEIFGFLGPNGAGKTTFIRCLMDFIRPTDGTVSLLGVDSRKSAEVRRHVGYVSADETLYKRWTVLEHIRFISAMRTSPVKEGLRLAELLGLDTKARAGTLSSGNKQKLALVLAMMHRPELLILDEPTRGLDPLLQHQIYTLLREYKQRGATVFMSSHNLTEVEKVCDRLAVIRAGQIVADETIESIRGKSIHIVEATFHDVFKASAYKLPNVVYRQLGPNHVRAEVRGDINPLLKLLAKTTVKDLEINHASLEEVFMRYYHD